MNTVGAFQYSRSLLVSTSGNWNAPGWSTMLKGTFSAATEKEFVLFLLDLNWGLTGDKVFLTY